METLRLKPLYKLTPGEVFKAEIADIQMNQVSIRFEGETITAKSLILPEARIGEPAFFVVLENDKGKIRLEMLRPGGDTHTRHVFDIRV